MAKKRVFVVVIVLVAYNGIIGSSGIKNCVSIVYDLLVVVFDRIGIIFRFSLYHMKVCAVLY